MARKDDQLEEKDKQIAKKDEQIQNKDNTINFLQRELIQAGVENEKKQKLLDNARRKEEAISESELKKKEWPKNTGGIDSLEEIMMKFELTKKLKQSYIYEIDEVDGECLPNNGNYSELAKYRYTVRSAL